MRICLDTNAYSALGKGNEEIAQILEMADEVIVPATVVGELMFGFLKGSQFSRNESDLNRFMAQDGVRFQPVTENISERYGYVKAALSQCGKLIPENDIWIAATALETGTRIVSYDTHFDNVGGLVRIAP
jgi:predicted nucleic acid-binding protein